jgi:hypothetical protein
MVPKGPYRLCTVNTAPERAKKLVGRMVQDVREDYTIDYVENAERESLLYWFGVKRRMRRVRC